MKQRLGLAQALIAEPQVLLLDEPTDGVDPLGRAEIRAILERQKQAGRTVFLNSHLLSEVERLCDRVAILHRGEVVRLGTIDELTRSDLVYRIVTTAPLPAAVASELARLVVAVRPLPDGVEVSVARDEEIDAVVDLLRARGVALRGLSGKRLSLEEVFLQSVRDGAPASGSGAAT
jgi:ABC-2 type transport system ATP-binding protein